MESRIMFLIVLLLALWALLTPEGRALVARIAAAAASPAGGGGGDYAPEEFEPVPHVLRL